VELKTASTELEDVLAEEIEGYQIQQRELKTAEEKVRAREDEVAIEKAKIEEVKEQQRQIAVQLHEQKEAFTKAQQVQHQTFEEYQRNAETLVDRMQGALARIEEMEYQQLIPQLQPLQFEFMGGICGFGVNCSRYLFRRLYTWHKHRHALLP
jgi:chromosome segregation ATPase